MKLIKKSILFLVAAASLVGGRAYAQRPLIDVAIDSAAILIGEQTTLHLTVTADKDRPVQIVIPNDTLMTGVEVLNLSKADSTEIENDRLVIKQDVLITSFDSSLYLLPPLKVIDGVDTVYSNQVALKVSTIPVNADKPEEFNDIKTVWKPPFVFTNPMVAYSNYMKAFKADVKLVSGSTGWMAEHGEEIKKLCTEGGKTLFWSSNFSLGVSIFSAVNKYLAKIMNQFPAYDVTMSETHHIHKLDAPSGTAITLAEGILEKLDRKDKWVKGTFLAPDGTISGTNDCAPNELPIASIREGEVFGLHTIRYESDVDSITITHDAKSRGGFVLGAVLAAEYTATHEGFLGMSDLFPFLND